MMGPILEAVIFRMLLHKAGGKVFSYFGKHEGGPPTTLWIVILLWPPEQKMNSPHSLKDKSPFFTNEVFSNKWFQKKSSIENTQ